MLCTLIGAIILSINIQVGINMHLYDDIGDALSSLRGSTSSIYLGKDNESYLYDYDIVHFADGGILSLYGEMEYQRTVYKC